MSDVITMMPYVTPSFDFFSCFFWFLGDSEVLFFLRYAISSS